MYCMPLKMNVIIGGYAHNPSVLKTEVNTNLTLPYVHCHVNVWLYQMHEVKQMCDFTCSKTLIGKKLQCNMPSNL